MTTKEQLEEIRLEKEQLELEVLRAQVAQERQRRAQSKLTSEQTEASLNATREEQAKLQASCRHHKGGKDIAGIFNGNAPDYSVIKHTMPWLETIVMCTRCQKLWRQGTPGYQEALNYPTDNEPTSASFFTNTYPVHGTRTALQLANPQLATA